MSGESEVIEAVKEGDVEKVRRLLEQPAAVHARDEQGWTPLNWAAGKGDTEMVRLLLDHGADVTETGRDNRTPLRIAKAAGRKEAAEILTAAEKDKGVWEDPRETRPYCRAYYLRDLRRFSGWSEDVPAAQDDPGGAGTADAAGEEDSALNDSSIVYLHQDFTVTRSMWHDEDVVYQEVTPEWRSFCAKDLGFAIPDDLV